MYSKHQNKDGRVAGQEKDILNLDSGSSLPSPRNSRFFNNTIKEYSIILTPRPDNKSQAYLGVAILKPTTSSIFGKLRNKIVFFKDPNTYYKPKIAEELTIFIYNLLWWIVLINLSVALFNLLPLGISDGGRVFFLTILALTKSEKIAKKLYKFSTYFILFIFLLLTALWFFSYF